MDFSPKTPEDEKNLYNLLTNADTYEIKLTVQALALDGDVITRRAIEKLEGSQFGDEESRNRMMESVKSDIAQAIGVLLEADKVLPPDTGMLCRSASHHIELVSGE